MRQQKVSIQKHDASGTKEGLPTKFNGTMEDLKEHLLKLHKKQIPGSFKKLTNKQITFTENKDKHKKLGMGLTIVADNIYTNISFHTFWPVKLEKPKHIK